VNDLQAYPQEGYTGKIILKECGIQIRLAER
jgi:hypothetical protein